MFRSILSLFRLLWRLWLWLWLSLCLSILLLALLFPRLPDYKPEIEHWLSQVLEQPIVIGNLTTYWVDWMPTVALQEVRLLETNAEQSVVEIAYAEIVFNVWASIKQAQVVTNSVAVTGSQFTLARNREGNIKLVGLRESDTTDNSFLLGWLLQQPHLSLHATTLTWLEPEPPPFFLANLKLSVERQNSGHKITGRVNLPQQTLQGVQAKTFSFESWLDIQQLSAKGQFAFEQLQFVSKSPLANFFQTEHTPSIEQSQVSESPLTQQSLSQSGKRQSLSGEFHAHQQANGAWQIDIKQHLASPNQKPWLTHQMKVRFKPVIPTTTSMGSSTNASGGQIELSGSIKVLPLDQLLNNLPAEIINSANPKLPETLAAIQGTLHDIQWAYSPNHWRVRLSFADLTTEPVGQLPGISGLSGQIDIKPNKGTVYFHKAAVTLNLPNLYSHPLSLAQLKGNINWQRTQKLLRLTTKKLQAVDNNMKVQVVGSIDIPLTGGTPNSHLSVTLRNGQLSQLPKYIPDQYLPDVAHQLNEAQLGGQLSKANILISGKGEQTRFEFSGDVKNVHLNLAMKETPFFQKEAVSSSKPEAVSSSKPEAVSSSKPEAVSASKRDSVPSSLRGESKGEGKSKKTNIAIKGLSGHLDIKPNKGTLRLLEAAVTLNMPSMYSHPLSLAQLKGNINWQRTQKLLRLTTKKLQAVDNNMKVQVVGSIDIPLTGGTPNSHLSVTLRNGQLSQLPKYIPDQYLPDVAHQLNEAQLGGQLSKANILISGKGEQTRFEFSGDVKNVHLKLAMKETFQQFLQKEAVSSSKPEAVSSSKREAVSSSKPEAVSSSKREAVSSSKPEAVSSSKPEAVSASKREAVSSSKPEAVSASKPEAVSSSKPDSVPSSIRGESKGEGKFKKTQRTHTEKHRGTLTTNIAIKGLSGHLDIKPNKGTLRLLEAAVTLNMPSMYSHPLSLTQLKGNIRWKRTQKKWRLTTKKVQAFDKKMKIKISGRMEIPVAGGTPDSNLSVTLRHGQLSQLQKYLPDQYLPDVAHQLSKAQLGGHLSKANLLIKGKGQQTHFQFKGHLNQLSVINYQLPTDVKTGLTVKGLSGYLDIEPNKGSLRLKQAAVTLNMPNLYSHPLSLTQLNGTLRWQRDQKQWRLTTKKLQAFDKNMKIKVSGRVDIPREGSVPYTHLKVTLRKGQFSRVPHYIPDKKSPQLAHWFNNAQLKGRLSKAHALIQGPINALFDDTSRFEFKADINNAHINYAQGWPHLSRLKAQVVIQKRSLTITAQRGKILNSKVRHLAVEIADLSAKAPLINVVGNTQGQAADGLRFVQKSPLHKTVDLGILELDGLIDLQLKLAIPLDDKSGTVQGKITFKNTRLHDKSLDITLTDVAGTLNFGNDKVSAKNMQGKLLGNPVRFSIITLRNKRPKRTTVQLTGLADPLFLSQQLTQLNPAFAQLPLHRFLSGTTHWTTTLNFPNEEVTGNNYTDIHLEADLLGMNIKLPAPLGKTAQEQQPLSLSVRLYSEGASSKGAKIKEEIGDTVVKSPAQRKNRRRLGPSQTVVKSPNRRRNRRVLLHTVVKSPLDRGNRGVLRTTNQTVVKSPIERENRDVLLGGILVRVRYGDKLNGVFRFNKTGLERGTLILGTTPAHLPKQAHLNIEGHTPNLSITTWLNQLKAKNENNGQRTITNYQLPITLLTDIHFDRFEMLGQTFANVALQAKYAKHRWMAAITGTGIEGQIIFDLAENAPSLDLNFRELTLTIPQTQTPTENQETNQETLPEPRRLPSLSFHCDALQIGDINLGNVDLHTQPNHDGLKLNLQAQARGLNLQAKGQWRYVVQRHQTVLQASLTSESIDLMLQQLGYQNPPIVGEQSQITLNAYWQGAPHQFKLSTLVGTLSLVIMEGHIVEVEPGTVGRLFGLFDVYTLHRRISLDFSDVFNKGFGFSTIAGIFFIKDGRARTEHLILQAPSARIKISGQTSLVGKNYDQIVTVFPHLSNPLPVAGALTGGLSGGIAALVLQQLLQKELEKVLNYQYHITGPWEKPKIVPLSKHQ